MIHVTIYKTKTHEYAGFDVEGHAGFAESGQDIVCAAVSMLVINTINSIEQLVSDEYTLTSDEEDGVIQFRLSKRDPAHPGPCPQLLARTPEQRQQQLRLGLAECRQGYRH